MFFLNGQYSEREQRQLFIRRLFRRVFLDDWLLKSVALAITMALWLGVTGLREPIPVRLKNITLNQRVSNNMEITNSPVQEVDIVVTGDKRKIDRLNVQDLVMSVDLTDVKPGDRIVQLSPDTVNLELPSGIKLDEIQPNRIAVRLETVEERDIIIKPQTEGSVAEGYEIYSQTVIPAKVRVRGAESAVKSLDSISTERIALENRTGDFTARQTGLNVSNPNLTVLDGIVDVIFKIGEKRGERIFVVPVVVGNEFKRATVVLFGARSLLENLDVGELKIELRRNDDGEIVPQLILPAELQDKIEVRKIKLS
ncbi:MAG: CdaR family protein [Pyrinomonadaceae bacterium]